MSSPELPTQLALGSRFRALQVPLAPLTIPYDSGNTRASEVPKTYLTKDLAIRFTGTLQVATTLTLIDGANSPLQLLQRIELSGDGNETLWAISGKDAYRLQHLFQGKAGELVAPGTAVANQPMVAFIIISAEAVNMAIPVDSYLDLREFEKTELRITWAPLTSLFSAGTATMTDGQVEVYANQSTEGLPSIGFRRYYQFDERTILSTQTDFRFTVPRSGLLAGILFRAERDAVPDDTIVNFITLESDSSHTHVKRRSWKSLQAENVVRYQLDGGAAADGGRIKGYAYLDFLEDGRLAAAINTEALNELALTLDVTLGSGTTRIVRMTYCFFKALQRAG